MNTWRIAKEMLIFLCWIIFFITSYFFIASPDVELWLKDILLISSLSFYPLYLFIKSTTWTIRTLKIKIDVQATGHKGIKIKKMLAREGFMLVWTVGCGLIMWTLGKYQLSLVKICLKSGPAYAVDMGLRFANLSFFVAKILFSIYAIFLLIRFILWVIRTLKKK